MGGCMSFQKGSRQNGLVLAASCLICLSLSVSAASRRQVNVDQHITGLLGEQGGYSWVETGRIDLDGDGVRDLLLNAHKDKEEPTSKRWYVYLRDDGHYYFSLPETELTFGRQNLEYRKIRPSDGQKVLMRYISGHGGKKLISANWYERIDRTRYEQHYKRISKDDLLPAGEGEIVSSSPDDEWQDRGTNIRNLLDDYTRHYADDYEGEGDGVLPGSDLGEKVNLDRRIWGLMSSGGGYEWVESGELDLDGDGYLDVLIEAHTGTPDKFDHWEVYFNRGGEYFFHGRDSMLTLHRKNHDLRRVKGYGDRKVLVWYDSRNGNDGVFWANAYSKRDDGSYDKSMVRHSERDLLLPSGGDNGSSSSGADWSSRGMKIEKVLHNYARHYFNDNSEVFSLYRLDVDGSGGSSEGEGRSVNDGKSGSVKSRLPWEIIGFVGALVIALTGLALLQRRRTRTRR